MKNGIDFNKSHNLPSVNLRLKYILSLLCFGVFIFLGFASIDEGDPLTKSVDCAFLKPPVAVAQKVSFNTYDQDRKTPIGLMINFVISEYDKVNDNGVCSLALRKTYNKSVEIVSLGNGSFTLSKSYLSNDDEIEIFFETFLPGYYKVSRTFILKKSDPGIDFSINVRKIDQYP